MNKQHLIALDLDGTLLTDEQHISPYTKQVLLESIAAGHIVVIATGRPHRSSIQYYHKLGLTTPMVNFNGALIHHPLNQKWDVLHSPMENRTALSIVDACYELEVNNILAEVEDNVYLDRHDDHFIKLFKTTQHDSKMKSPFTIGNIKNKLKEDPTSLLIHPREEHIEDLTNHLNDQHAELVEHRIWGAPLNVFEVIKKGMNKAVGLRNIARYYNIPKERIIAFGDEDNDLEMIDYAGVGVAMGNAISELKSIAKHVTLSNEEDGIGDFLNKYLNIKVKIS